MANGDGIVQLGKPLDVGERTIAHIDKATAATRAALAGEAPNVAPAAEVAGPKSPGNPKLAQDVLKILDSADPAAQEKAAEKARKALEADKARDVARNAREAAAKMEAAKAELNAAEAEFNAGKEAAGKLADKGASTGRLAAAENKYIAAAHDVQEAKAKVAELHHKADPAAKEKHDARQAEKAKAPADPKPVSQLTPEEKAARLGAAGDARFNRAVFEGPRPLEHVEAAKTAIDNAATAKKAAVDAAKKTADEAVRKAVDAAKPEAPKPEPTKKANPPSLRQGAAATGIGALASGAHTALNGGSAGEVAESTAKGGIVMAAASVAAKVPGPIWLKGIVGAAAGVGMALGLDKLLTSDPQAPGAGPNGPQPAVGPVPAPVSAASGAAAAATPASGAASAAAAPASAASAARAASAAAPASGAAPAATPASSAASAAAAPASAASAARAASAAAPASGAAAAAAPASGAASSAAASAPAAAASAPAAAASAPAAAASAEEDVYVGPQKAFREAVIAEAKAGDKATDKQRSAVVATRRAYEESLAQHSPHTKPDVIARVVREDEAKYVEEAKEAAKGEVSKPAAGKTAKGAPVPAAKSAGKDCHTIDLSSAYTVKKGDTLHAMVRHENQKDEVAAITEALQKLAPAGKKVTQEDAYAAYERVLMNEIGLKKASKLEVGTVIPVISKDDLALKLSAINAGVELAKGGVQKTDTAAQYGLPANGGKAKGRDC